MKKGYWVVCYRKIQDPNAIAAYGALAGPAIQAAGGKALVRGAPVETQEGGLMQRTVVIEFESVEKAQAAYRSAAYKEALQVLGNGVERDLRILEGVE